MKRIAMLAILSLTTGAMAAPVPKEAKSHGTLVVGIWKIEAISCNGKKGSIAGYFTIDAEGGCMCHSDATYAHKYKADRSFRFDPKTGFIDAQVGDQPITQGVYKLDGDTLFLAFTLDVDRAIGRPKVAEAGQSVNLFTLKRVQPEVKK